MLVVLLVGGVMSFLGLPEPEVADAIEQAQEMACSPDAPVDVIVN